MKKILVILTLVITALSGCALLEGVNDTLDYATKAKEHIEKLLTFGEEAPQMIKEAANNPEIKKELKDRLITLKEDINKFNQIDAPAIAEDIHQKIIAKNQEIEEAINKAIEDGQLAIEKLENSQLFKLINDVTSLLKQIEQLGQ